MLIDSLTASFADLGGSNDVRFESDLVIEYIARTTPTVRAVKSSSGFSNFKADRMCARNVDRAVDLQGFINGCSIDVIDVGDFATDLPTTLPPNIVLNEGEGSWIPTLSLATPGNFSVSYSTQSGLYRKIARMSESGAR